MKLNEETNLYELEPSDKKPMTQEEKKQQLEYLIGFIENFHHTMDYEKIFGMCRFILISLMETPEDFHELCLMLDSLEALQRLELEVTHEKTHNFNDCPNTAFKILKDILEDLEGKNPQELKEDATELFEQFYKRPTSLMMPNNKVTNLIFDSKTDLSSRVRKINEGAKKKGHEIIVNTQIISELPIEPIDREVLNGVFSIIEKSEEIDNNSRPLFTETQLIEAFTYNPKPTEKQKEEVRESLNRLRTTIINLDWTEYALKLGLPLNDTLLKTNDPILMLHEYQFVSGGRVTSGYKVAATPILYTYAKATKRIVNVEKPLLKVNASNTQEAILIKNYMLRRIKEMYNTKNHMDIRSISYETMFEYCRCNNGTKTEMNRRRNTAKKILDSWVVMKYIKGYAEVKEGKSIKKIDLKLFDKEPQI